MPRGKAPDIKLTKIQRRSLENLRLQLEDYANEHSRAFKSYRVEQGKTRLNDEYHYMSLLKLKAILLAADGLKNREIANLIEMSEKTIGKWRNDFFEILSRKDLDPRSIKDFFWFLDNTVELILEGYTSPLSK